MKNNETLSKAKKELRDRLGKYNKYWDFYFKDNCFCFKLKTDSEHMESKLKEGCLDTDFIESIDQVYWRLHYDFSKLEMLEEMKTKQKKKQIMIQRSIRNKLIRKLK